MISYSGETILSNHSTSTGEDDAVNAASTRMETCVCTGTFVLSVCVSYGVCMCASVCYACDRVVAYACVRAYVSWYFYAKPTIRF